MSLLLTLQLSLAYALVGSVALLNIRGPTISVLMMLSGVSLLLMPLNLAWLLQAHGRMVIRAPQRGAIQLGRGVRINSPFRSNLVGLATPTVLQCLGAGRISIGDHSGCSGVVFSAWAGIQVGRHVQIGGNVRVYDHDFHLLDYRVRRDPARDRRECAAEPVFIGDDMFIGANAIILKGVHIGECSLIGAVVTQKEIPPDSLVIGNPAQVRAQQSPAR